MDIHPIPRFTASKGRLMNQLLSKFCIDIEKTCFPVKAQLFRTLIEIEEGR